MQSNLRKLQMEELRILKVFVTVCEENNLSYYLLGGTLLGAVRHNGFIPWDDDIDVCMPRPDLNKLLSMNDIWPDDIYMETYETNSEYRYGWPRLISSNMQIINRSANIPRTENAWIDLIPLDGFPNKGISRKLHKLRLSFWWNLNQIVQYDELVDQKRKRSRKAEIAVKLADYFKWIAKFVDYKKCLKKLNNTLQRVPFESNTDDVINYLCAYGFREVFPRESFGEGATYIFEESKMNGPKDADTILKIIYDENYMQLPPENERNKHNSEVIDFYE